VTQNIDSLHIRAGVPPEKVIELHGHMRGLVCSDHRTALNPLTYRSGECTFCIPEDSVDAIAAAYGADTVPRCPDCGCPLRTETVMFGQPMPLHEMDKACLAIDEADLFLVIGSTLLVQPANELPCIALRNGAPLVMINFDATQYDAYAKGLIRQKAGEFLGAVSERLQHMPESPTPATPLRRDPAATDKSQRPEQVRQMRVAKEGSRCGKEIAVNAKACGMQFFCTAVAEPQGDLELLEQSMAAMNAECPNIGKMLLSDGPHQLTVLACIPEALRDVLSYEDWLKAVKQATGGTVIESTAISGKMVVPASASAFPIKLKEPGITAAINFLKEKSLFPDEEDSDECVFGDDDFPLS